MLRFVIVGFENEQAVACGAMKELATDTMEIKRMFVLPPYRGQGLATGVLEELEKWAAETGIATCRLETGKRQPEAIGLYLKNGYRVIPNYGQYAGIDNSVCFEKKLGERMHQL
ncbi:MAG: family acetyltransferase [Sediminibacterium sp.]|nr:family acetyltransferase [Sediminibacterium sp.]